MMLLFLKTHVRGYLRADGTHVLPHERGRMVLRPAWKIRVARVTGNEIGGDTIKELRASAEMYVNTHYRGASFINREMNHPVVVSRDGIKKILSHSVNETYCYALVALPQIISSATMGRLSNNRHPDQKNKFPMISTLYAPLLIGDDLRVVKVVFKSSNNGISLYDLDVGKKIEGDVDLSWPGKEPGTGSDSPSWRPARSGDAREEPAPMEHYDRAMSIGDMERFINTDGGVMKKSLLFFQQPACAGLE